MERAAQATRAEDRLTKSWDINIMTTASKDSWLRAVSRKISGAWLKTEGAIDQAIRYADCFGVFRGPLLYMLAMARRSSDVRLAQVVVRGKNNSARFQLRLGSTDISVFNGIYRQNEYGWELGGSPQVIVDAGAYIGLSSAFFAMRHPEAQIIAIEPSEANFELLLRNTASFKNIHAIHGALWTHSGSLTLVDPGSGAWGFRVEEPEPAGAENHQIGAGDSARAIAAVTMPDVIRQFGLDRIDLLKLDIEGGEKEVFADSGSWIAQVDAICLELHDRFKPGCSRSFFRAVEEFPIESWRGENVLVLRKESRLNPEGSASVTRELTPRGSSASTPA
jgi:FkbM family methyltransferase